MLILMFLSVFIPTNHTKAETINGHKVYTKNLIEKKIDERELIKKRIDEIRYYYYKQPKKLTKKRRSSTVHIPKSILNLITISREMTCCLPLEQVRGQNTAYIFTRIN